MDQKIIEAFAKPPVAYWHAEFGRGLKLASSTTRPASFRASDVVVTALLSGDLNGEIHYVIDEGTMQDFHSSITGQWPESVDDEVTGKFVETVRKFARATTRRLAKDGHDVKIRVVGAIISDGELMGPTDEIGQLEHLFAKRKGSTEEDHVRVWVRVREEAREEVGSDSSAGRPPAETKAPKKAAKKTPRVIDLETELADEPEPAPADVEKQPDAAPDVIRARRFELIDENGNTRAVLGALGNGSPHLVLSDASGRMRAAVALSKSGAPRIMLFDEIGERIYEEPPMIARHRAA